MNHGRGEKHQMPTRKDIKKVTEDAFYEDHLKRLQRLAASTAKRLGRSEQEVADRAGLAVTTVAGYLRGNTKRPQDRTTHRIFVRGLNCTFGNILGPDGKPIKE